MTQYIPILSFKFGNGGCYEKSLYDKTTTSLQECVDYMINSQYSTNTSSTHILVLHDVATFKKISLHDAIRSLKINKL